MTATSFSIELDLEDLEIESVKLNKECQYEIRVKNILLSLMGSTVSDVSLKEKLGYEAVMGIIRRHVQSEVNWELISILEQIGLDEISLKKGHKDFVTHCECL